MKNIVKKKKNIPDCMAYSCLCQLKQFHLGHWYQSYTVVLSMVNFIFDIHAKLCKLNVNENIQNNIKKGDEFMLQLIWIDLIRYLLRSETIWEYVCLFVYSALNIQLNAAFLFVADAGFIGINLYLIAAFEDLIDNLQEIEQIK